MAVASKTSNILPHKTRWTCRNTCCYTDCSGDLSYDVSLKSFRGLPTFREKEVPILQGMEQNSLEILVISEVTRPHEDLQCFDSFNVKCLLCGDEYQSNCERTNEEGRGCCRSLSGNRHNFIFKCLKVLSYYFINLL
jgi:hypothetical protein